MKKIASFLFLLFIVSFGSGKEKVYTGSTPAADIIRSFLAIPLSDSIDFIRWKLILRDNEYQLQCNYGIGKPNTNGFYEPKTVKLSGTVKRDNSTNTYTLQNGQQALKLIELNSNLLHIANKDNTLLIGGDGWSYAINNMTPRPSKKNNLPGSRSTVRDSMAFGGRTPCGVPNIIPAGKECYKLKWSLILYGNPAKNEPSTYKLLGTPYRVEGGKKGNWQIITGKDGRIIYKLFDEKGKPFIHLLKLDDGVLIFTDEKGNLLVGDHDFSYTLNRHF